MSDVLDFPDIRQLPSDLTKSEKLVADIALELGFSRPDRTITLTEVVDEFTERTGRRHKNTRSTVNHFIKGVCLKTASDEAVRFGWVLKNQGKLGRGNTAEFTWMPRQ